MRLGTPLVWSAFLAGGIAVAGIVHVVTVFNAPIRAKHDAFARVAAVAAPNVMTSSARVSAAGVLPFRDGGMAAAACRFDLAAGPLAVTITPLDASFLSLGMHTRSGIPFYGLNVWSGGHDALAMTVMTEAQKTAVEADGAGTGPRQLRVVAPEPEGLILVQTPSEDSGLVEASMRHVSCATVTARATAGR